MPSPARPGLRSGSQASIPSLSGARKDSFPEQPGALDSDSEDQSIGRGGFRLMRHGANQESGSNHPTATTPYRQAKKSSMTTKLRGGGLKDEEGAFDRVPSAEDEAVDDDLPLQNQVDNVVSRNFKQSATTPHGQHSSAAKRWHTAMAAASAWSAFHTSTPLVTAITINAIQAVFVFLGVILVVVFVVACWELALAHGDVCNFATYRLQAADWLLDGGLLRGGCRSLDTSIVGRGDVVQDGGEMWYEAQWAEAEPMNGFWVQAKEGQRVALGGLKLMGSDDGVWSECWEPRWAAAMFPMHGPAGQQVNLDLRPHWTWVLVSSVHGIRGLGFLAVAGCGRMHVEVQGQLVFILMEALVGTVYAVAASVCFAKQPSVTCALWAGAGLVSWGVGWSVTTAHRYLLSVLLVYLAMLMGVHVAERPVEWNKTLPVALVGDGIGLLLGLTLMAVRAYKLRQTAMKIRDDRTKYDEIWGQMVQGEQEHLKALSEVVRHIKPAHASRQYNRKPPPLEGSPEATPSDPPPSSPLAIGTRRVLLPGAVSANSSGGRRIPTRAARRWKSLENLFVPSLTRRDSTLGSGSEYLDTIDFDSPVSDLDQLFIQAEGLYPLLRAKVQAWAFATNGMLLRLDASGNKGYGKVPDVDAGPATKSAAQIKWAKLKRPERAIEKVLRSYGGDVSKLCDICRQSIIFDSVAEMKKCLQSIHNDPEVAIVRVKNRLDEHYDSSLSLGYRDVAINLRIVNKHAQELFVDTHIGELQLIMREFAENKSDQGHKRYVEFRNARAE